MNGSLSSYGPLRVPIECSGTTHHLVWRSGRLETPDHPNLDAELILAALDGPQCACADRVLAWDAHSRDLKALVLGPRLVGGPVPVVPANSVMAGTARRQRMQMLRKRGVPQRLGGPPVPMMPGTETEEDPLLTLLGVNPVLAVRLVVTVASHWIARLSEETPEAGQARPALAAALYGRVAWALRSWLGHPATDLTIEDSGTEPELHWAQAGYTSVFRLDWLIDVWGLGLTVVWDRLVLGIEEESDDRIMLRAVDRAVGGLEYLAITTKKAEAP